MEIEAHASNCEGEPEPVNVKDEPVLRTSRKVIAISNLTA